VYLCQSISQLEILTLWQSTSQFEVLSALLVQIIIMRNITCASSYRS